MIIQSQNKLLRVSYLCLFFMLVEAVGGYVSNSIAVMSDAAHLLSDLLSFFVGILALRLATKGARSYLPFGYHRAEVLGAIISILIVWVLTVVLLWEAIDRFIHPPKEFDAGVMMGTAALGIVVNILMGFSLHQGSHKHFHTHLDGTRCSGNHGHHSEPNSYGKHDHVHGEGCNHSHDDHHDSHSHKHASPSKHGSNALEMAHVHSHSGPCDHDHEDEHEMTADTVHDHELPGSGRKHSDDDILMSVDSASLSKHLGESRHKPKAHKHRSKHEGHSCSDHDHSHDHHGHDHGSHSKKASIVEVLAPGLNHNVNVRAAYAHIVGDLIQSIGVFFIAVVIYYFPEWTLFDPICTVVFSVIVVFTTVPVARDCTYVLMEGTDPKLKGELAEKVRSDLEELPGVKTVNDLRIWTICEGKKSLQVTLASDQKQTSVLIASAKAICKKNGIQVSSIEIDNSPAFEAGHQKDSCSDHLHGTESKPKTGHSHDHGKSGTSKCDHDHSHDHEHDHDHSHDHEEHDHKKPSPKHTHSQDHSSGHSTKKKACSQGHNHSHDDHDH